MAQEQVGVCEICGHEEGPILVAHYALHYCEGCNGYYDLKYTPRSFDLPNCEHCGQQFLVENRVGDGPSRCPVCSRNELHWAIESFCSLVWEPDPEPPPKVGELVHGFLRLAGERWVVKFISSSLHGALVGAAPDLVRGAAIEARVTAVQGDELEVEFVRAFDHLPPWDADDDLLRDA